MQIAVIAIKADLVLTGMTDLSSQAVVPFRGLEKIYSMNFQRVAFPRNTARLSHVTIDRDKCVTDHGRQTGQREPMTPSAEVAV
jgi:hypothetical protein